MGIKLGGSSVTYFFFFLTNRLFSFSWPLSTVSEAWEFAGHVGETISVSGSWTQSKKSDEIAKSTPKCSTKTHKSIWEYTLFKQPRSENWHFTGLCLQHVGQGHGTAPKAVPTCEGRASQPVWRHLFIADLPTQTHDYLCTLNMYYLTVQLNQNGIF